MPIRILLIAGSDADAQAAIQQAERGLAETEWRRVSDRAGAEAALAEPGWDLVLADHALQGFGGLEALALARRMAPDVPFILLADRIGEETAVEAMRRGAHDCVIKDSLSRLGPVVRRALDDARARRERRDAEEALRESERRFRIMADCAPVLIWVSDAEMSCAYVNKSWLQFTGRPAEGDLNADWMASVHPDDVGALRAARESARAKRENYSVEYRLRRAAGDFRWILETGAPRWNGNGLFAGFIGSALDITERREGERRIQEQLRQLAALRSIDMAITASLDLRVTLHVILDQTTGQLGVDAAQILLVNPHTQQIEHGASRGFRTDAHAYVTLRMGEGYAGQAALSRERLIVPDLRSATGERGTPRAQNLAEEGFVALFVMPLLVKGHVVGVLELYHRDRLDPDQGWLRFFEAIAGQGAIAIENAGHFDDMQRSHVDLGLAYEGTLDGWARSLDLREGRPEGNAPRLADLAMRLGREAGMGDEELAHLRRGALLHDVGLLAVPDSILFKPGPLSDEEWKVIRGHPMRAYEILYPIPSLRPAIDVPYCHHERWDGSGYPRGLKGEQIPPSARIFAIADVWDALTSPRPQRAAWTEDEAAQRLLELAGVHFDANLVSLFLEQRNAGR